MNQMLLDLWYDLKQKKLWPVAVGLVLALIAVPLVLKKGSEPAPAPSTAAAPSGPAASTAPVVELEGEKPADSKLDLFDARNPFKKVVSEEAAAAAAAAGVGQTSSGGDQPATGGSAPAGGDTGAPGGSTPGPSVGSEPGKGGSGGGGDKSDDTAYTYTVDVRFGRRDSERKHNLERLEFLPNSRQPLLVFMGVSTDRESALFMIDTSLDQTGEGTCKPSTETCSFVYLKVDEDENDHYFSDKESGAEYHIELVAINKVSTKALAARKRAMRKSNAARAARLKKKEPRPFSFFPLLVDEQG